MIYLNTSTTFRLSEWPKSCGSTQVFFKRDKLQYNMVPLIDYLSKTLYDIGKAFVYRTTFSLTNIVSPVSGLSYGYNDIPSYRMLRLSPIVCSFAFRYNNKYVAKKEPRYCINAYPHVNLWGSTLRTSSDFMTISIPRSVIKECGIWAPNMREVQWLYYLIGAFSKGFVNRCNYYDPNTYDFKSLVNNKQAILYVGLPSLFSKYEYADWIYSDRAWQSMPNALHPSAADDIFCAFYCRYLRRHWKKYSTANVIEIEKRIRTYVHNQVLDCLSLGQDKAGVITRMVEFNYNLPAMTQVDAYTDKLLEFYK